VFYPIQAPDILYRQGTDGNVHEKNQVFEPSLLVQQQYLQGVYLHD
jgi:hypothetical protein